MTAATGSRPVGTVGPGDHLCLGFASDTEQHEVTTAFVRKGLSDRAKVFYFTDTSSAVPGFLETGDPAVRQAAEKGQLAVLSSTAYQPDRPFDPGALITRLHQMIDAALAEGYAGAWLTGESTWMLRAGLSPDQIAAYERLATGAFATRPACGLCQYDRRRFPAAVLATALAAHPHTVVPDPVYADKWVTFTPAYAPAGLRVAGEIDLANASAWQAALAAAAASSDQDVHLDLSGLGFIGMQGTRALVLAAENLAGGRRLVLDSAPRELMRILRLTGWDHATNVVVGE